MVDAMLPIMVKCAAILKFELVNTQLFHLWWTNGPNQKKLTAVKDHMLICNQPVSFDDFKVLASSNSEFNLKIKESLLILRDQPILNKNEASLPLHLFD